MDDRIVAGILVGKSDPRPVLAEQQRHPGRVEFPVVGLPEFGEYVPFVDRPVLPGHGMPEVGEVRRRKNSGFEHRPDHVRLVQVPGDFEELFGSGLARVHGIGG